MMRFDRLYLAGSFALIAAACSPAPPAASPAPDQAPDSQTVTAPPLAMRMTALAPVLDTANWVDSTLASLSLRERVGQMVWFWTLGDYTAVDDSTFAEALAWVEKDGVGGLSMSLGTPIEVAAKLNYMERRARVPLIVG